MRPHILLVDDDPLILSASRAWLESCGHEIVTADGGSTGLNALQGATFDLMIVNIFMPNMRGLESVRMFHQSALCVPLIAISRYVFAAGRTPVPEFLRMALEVGASRCLRKPFTPEALFAVLDACLQEKAAPPMNVGVAIWRPQMIEAKAEAVWLQAVVEAATDGIVLVDAKECVRVFNPGRQRLFGYCAADVHGKNVKMLIPAWNYDGFGCRHDSLASTTIGQSKEGSFFPMELSIGTI